MFSNCYAELEEQFLQCVVHDLQTELTWHLVCVSAERVEGEVETCEAIISYYHLTVAALRREVSWFWTCSSVAVTSHVIFWISAKTSYYDVCLSRKKCESLELKKTSVNLQSFAIFCRLRAEDSESETVCRLTKGWDDTADCIIPELMMMRVTCREVRTDDMM